MLTIFILFLSYLLGSIPCSLLIAKSFGNLDIREIGSGNVGATNVYRAMGFKWAFVVFLCDALKGLVPVLLMWAATRGDVNAQYHIAGAGLLSITGHMFPVYLRFKGGKGVATSFGVFLFLSPIAALISVGVWALLTFKFKIVSLASLAAALVLPLVTWLTCSPQAYSLAALSAALMVIIAHRQNISRLLKGQEKITQKNIDNQ